MRTTITILLMLIPAAVFPCPGEAHRQFDFWVGNWRVELPDGKLAGTNRISKINGGCALLEEWSGASGTTGKSLNTYDASRKVWHQTWVDSDGMLLVIEGRFENGSMRLGNATDRITWTPLSQGYVRQLWEQTGDGGKTWKVIFDGRYIPQQIQRMQEFRAAQSRGDAVAASKYIAPGARMWFESKKGEGEPYTVGGGTWEQWDEYFGSETTMTNWRADGNSVSAEGEEMNDFMRLLDWQPKPWTITWWLDEQGQIKEVLLKGNREKPKSRLEEFKAWARANHPQELAYLMPKDRIDPTADRPERWRAILVEWRKSAGLPAVP